MILTGISALIGAAAHLLVFRKRFKLGSYDTWSNCFVNAFIAMAVLTILSDSVFTIEPNSLGYKLIAAVLGFGADHLGKSFRYRKKRRS